MGLKGLNSLKMLQGQLCWEIYCISTTPHREEQDVKILMVICLGGTNHKLLLSWMLLTKGSGQNEPDKASVISPYYEVVIASSVLQHQGHR